MNKQEIYEKVNQIILDEIAKGVLPWEKPWGDSFAHNGISGKFYNGINAFTLNILAMNYGANDYYTFQQIQECGASIKKGEKGNLVTFYKMLEYKDPTEPEEEPKKIPLLRYYYVWNRSQCEGLPEPKKEKKLVFSPIEKAEEIIKGYTDKPKIMETNLTKAFYRPSSDMINIPERERFCSVDAFYSTLFHELVHSTGSRKRLDRFDDASFFGSESYSREELVAELGACYLRNLSGIKSAKADRNSASYIDGWSRKLKSDPQMFFKAASAAQKAVDYMLASEKKYIPAPKRTEVKQTVPEKCMQQLSLF